MSSEYPGDKLPHRRKTRRRPKGPYVALRSKPDECPTQPKPPPGASGSSLHAKSDGQILSGIRQKSAYLGTAGRPYQQHLCPGPFPKLECKPLPQNPLKANGSKDTLPAIHNTPPVIEPGTNHRPRTNKSSVDSLPACISNRPKPELPKALYITPKEALKLFGEKLSDFEREEIVDFNQIYFLGLDALKVKAVKGAPQNHGFDDANGVYIKVLNDHIQYRYEVLELLGKGSFGQVLKCLDHKTKEQVALKILINKPRNHCQAQKELRILELLRKKDQHNNFSIIHMKEHFVFRGHVCITFELQGNNLYQAIRSQQQGFSQATVRRFTRSILKCLQVLHQERIIHCDLKPENIVLTKPVTTNIKVIDFGSSCHENERVFDYIQSRYYRAPEVILGNPYNMEIDMWSLGCIIVELYTGKPIFPGDNEKEQIALIMEVLGLPPGEVLETAPRRKKFFDANGNPRPYTNSWGVTTVPGSKDLASVLRSSDPLFLDFVKRCLEWDPKKRMTPDEAVAHDWFVEAQKRHHIRVCNRRINTPSLSVTKVVKKSPVKGQNNTSVKTPKPEIAGSPKQAAERSPKQGVTRPPKQDTLKSSKMGIKGVAQSPRQADERLLKTGVAVFPNLAINESPMHIPRPPNKPAERPPKPWPVRTHKVVNMVTTPPSQATEASSLQGVTKKSPKQVAVTASPKYGTADPPRQWIPRPPPKQEAATTATESSLSSSGHKCEVVRQRPGRRIIIPPSDARTLSSDQNLNQVCRRLN